MLTSHDYYCRCRICKPPLVGQAHRLQERLLTAGFTAAVILMSIDIARALLS